MVTINNTYSNIINNVNFGQAQGKLEETYNHRPEDTNNEANRPEELENDQTEQLAAKTSEVSSEEKSNINALGYSVQQDYSTSDSKPLALEVNKGSNLDVKG